MVYPCLSSYIVQIKALLQAEEICIEDLTAYIDLVSGCEALRCNHWCSKQIITRKCQEDILKLAETRVTTRICGFYHVPQHL